MAKNETDLRVDGEPFTATKTSKHETSETVVKFDSSAMNLSDWERLASIAAGLTGLFLLSRRLLIYLTLAAFSGYLLYRGLTGFCIIYDKANLSTRKADTGDESGDDSTAATVTKRWANQTHDIVEEASWESFPASDPPAFN